MLVSFQVPNTLEIVLLPVKDSVCQFPGLFLFTGPARMMRPVLNLAAQQIELIGTFEQVYLDICLVPEEAYEGVKMIYFLIPMLLHCLNFKKLTKC